MKRISVLTLILMILLSCTAFAETWKWVNSTDVMSYYIGSDAIHQQRQSFGSPITYAWLKSVYTPESVSSLIADYREAGLSTEGYDILVDSVSSLEFYVNNGSYFYRITSIKFYDADGNVIDFI